MVNKYTKTVKALLSLLLLTSLACQSQKVNPVYEQLKEIKGKGILFGHQDDLAYGIGWEYVEGESDVKRVAGDYPALFGWELGGIERGDQVNLDSVPFAEMHQLAVKGHQMGGINRQKETVRDFTSSSNGGIQVGQCQ